MIKIQLYGKSDVNFGDMGDFTGDVIIPLDFNSVVPLLQQKPVKCFSICENSFEKLFVLLQKHITKQDINRDLLILMRIKGKSSKSASRMGWQITSLMSKHSLVVWSAQEYKTYRFDFYFYDKGKVKYRMIPCPDLMEKLKNVKKIN